MSAICKVDGCCKPVSVKLRGFCNAHYLRFKTYGDPLGGGLDRGAPIRWMLEHLNSDSDECLLWPFSVNDHGYGRIRHEGREWVASRLMCTLANGPAPTERHEAAHSCGNGHGGCTQPNHLRWATPEENQADRVEHGTSNRGESNGQSRLTQELVKTALSMKAQGRLQRSIAADLGVSEMAVSDIFTGRRWSWLTGIAPKEVVRRRKLAANDNDMQERKAA